MDLSRKRDRDRLAPRREPYWQRLEEGAYLGFRRGPDTWITRFRSKNGGDGKQQYHQLGEALEYDEAKDRAEKWLEQLAGSPVRTIKRGSVLAALDAYLADLRRHGRAAAAAAADGRFKTALKFDEKTQSYEDPLAHLKLEDATRDDFQDWRDRLEPGRLPRTINRLVRAVTAGLNKANSLGHVGNPAAWRVGSLPDDEEAETAVFMKPLQRKSLIEASSADARAFFTGLDHSGGRPHELAAAKVSDFDGEQLKLSHRKGRTGKLRTRYVVLDEDGVTFFRAHAKGKPSSGYLFTDDGKPWRRDRWADEFRAASSTQNKAVVGEARIPADASAYSLRHARISELLQVYGIDPLTVAAQTGTSLRMIERTYFKFIRSAMLSKLSALKTQAAPSSP